MTKTNGPDSSSAWCGVRFDTSGASPTIVVRERIRLSDTDSSGLIYYGAVTAWFTRAQAELWYALGFKQEGLGPSPMMPVVNADISYHASLKLADEYELRAWVEEAGRTSLTVGFAVTKSGEPCVTASMTHVHLDPATMGPAPLPDAMIAAALSRR
jgi:YbgC/YbaW family acyl-CoA thioester hydrolase